MNRVLLILSSMLYSAQISGSKYSANNTSIKGKNSNLHSTPPHMGLNTVSPPTSTNGKNGEPTYFTISKSTMPIAQQDTLIASLYLLHKFYDKDKIMHF